MQNVQSSSLIARSDTMLGVCQGLGEDLGINPNWLRVGFAFAVIYNLEIAAAVYLGVGLVVAISRLAFPSRRRAAAAAPQAQPAEAMGVVAKQDAPAQPIADRVPLAVAA